MRCLIIFFLIFSFSYVVAKDVDQTNLFNVHKTFLSNKIYMDLIETLKLNKLDSYFLKKTFIHLQLGNYHFYNKEFKKSLQHLNIANNYCPNNPVTLFWLGQVYKKLQDYENAHYYFSRTYELDKRFKLLENIK